MSEYTAEDVIRKITENKARLKTLLNDSDFVDEDGYPTDRALEAIEKWHWDDIAGWFKFIEGLWAYHDFGWNEKDEPHDWDKDKIERFIGPILQERAYVIAQAKETNIKKDKHSPTLIQAASAQLAPRGVDMNQVEWNTYRQPDGLWYLTLMYPLRPGEDVKGEAVWIFDSGKRSLTAHDDGARWINGEERAPRTAQPTHGIVYQSEPPRLVAVKEETTQITVEKIEEVLDESAASDGVTKRIKLPSWDDIMFGKKSE